jgi:hypothetical protein
MHGAHSLGRSVSIHAYGRDIERSTAITAENGDGVAGPPESGLGDSDNRGSTIQVLIEVSPEPRPAGGVEPNVTVDNQ